MLQSAMDHDAILDINDEEKMKLDDKASLVAQRAAEALRQSRMLRRQDSISIPTWTGRSGAAGAPGEVRRRFGSKINSQLVSGLNSTECSRINGASTSQGSSTGLAGASLGKALSSRDLLARIQGNRESAIGAGIERQTVSGSAPSLVNGSERSPGSNRPTTSRFPPVSIQPEILIRQLCTFIQQSGGSARSAKIVEHFKDIVPSKDMALFKKLLKEIAVLRKEGGEGEWVLKPDYNIDKFGAG